MRIHRLAFLAVGVILTVFGMWLSNGVVDKAVLLVAGLCIAQWFVLLDKGKEHLP